MLVPDNSELLNEIWTADSNETQYKFKKLNATEAFACLEIIRVTLGSKIGELDVSALTFEENETEEKKMNALREVIQLVFKIPPNIVGEMQKRLFTQVYFQNGSTARSPLVLGGNEKEAFDKGSALDIYQVTARSFAINFFPFFKEIASMFPSPSQDSQPPNTET